MMMMWLFACSVAEKTAADELGEQASFYDTAAWDEGLEEDYDTSAVNDSAEPKWWKLSADIHLGLTDQNIDLSRMIFDENMVEICTQELVVEEIIVDGLSPETEINWVSIQLSEAESSDCPYSREEDTFRLGIGPLLSDLEIAMDMTAFGEEDLSFVDDAISYGAYFQDVEGTVAFGIGYELSSVEEIEWRLRPIYSFAW